MMHTFRVAFSGHGPLASIVFMQTLQSAWAPGHMLACLPDPRSSLHNHPQVLGRFPAFARQLDIVAGGGGSGAV